MEVALTLPILLMLVMGIVDFGRAFATRIAIQDASQEGALVAGFAPAETARIVTKQWRRGLPFPWPAETSALVVSLGQIGSP